MGIEDRDWFHEHRVKVAKGDVYDPKRFRGGRDGGYVPPKPVKEYWIPATHKASFDDEGPIESFGRRIGVRSWLLHLAIWLFVGFAIHKALGINEEKRAAKEVVRQQILEEKRRLEEENRSKVQKAYRSPYARPDQY